MTYDGLQSNHDSFTTFNHAISDDGRFAVFQSFATNLVPNDTNLAGDIFVRDRGDDSP